MIAHALYILQGLLNNPTLPAQETQAVYIYIPKRIDDRIGVCSASSKQREHLTIDKCGEQKHTHTHTHTKPHRKQQQTNNKNQSPRSCTCTVYSGGIQLRKDSFWVRFLTFQIRLIFSRRAIQPVFSSSPSFIALNHFVLPGTESAQHRLAKRFCQ